jgi:hypothetical protein
VLNLSQSVDDSAWVSEDGLLFATDHDGDTVDRVWGEFEAGSILAGHRTPIMIMVIWPLGDGVPDRKIARDLPGLRGLPTGMKGQIRKR